MSMAAQVLLGTSFLILCTLVHVGIVAATVPLVARFAARLKHRGKLIRTTVLLSLTVFGIVLAHAIQIWTWAFVFKFVGLFPDFQTSFYFATVTYTTLGYGDIVLGEGLRIFATFGAITGLLTFGISTAFLIGVIGRILPAEDQGHKML